MDREKTPLRRRARDWVGGIVLGAVVAGCVFTAVAADFNELGYAPFSGQSMWLMKQARAIIETYQVDGEEKPARRPRLRCHQGHGGRLGDPYTRSVTPRSSRKRDRDGGEYGGLGMYVGRGKARHQPYRGYAGGQGGT